MGLQSAFSSVKVGVGTLFSDNFNFPIHKVFSDLNGCFIICDIVADSKRLTVANIYTSNKMVQTSFSSFFIIYQALK